MLTTARPGSDIARIGRSNSEGHRMAPVEAAHLSVATPIVRAIDGEGMRSIVNVATEPGHSLFDRANAVAERMPSLMGAVLAAERQRWTDIPAATELVADIESLVNGGKYVRPRLAVLAYYGFGGLDGAVADRLAMAVQLLHVGLCIHDDLIDGGQFRHGRPTVQVLAEAREVAAGRSGRAWRKGASAAVLAGDLVINSALGQVVAAGSAISPSTTVALVSEILDAIDVVIVGEALDIDGEVQPPDGPGAIRVAELKTASYSISLPLRLGALACDAPSDCLDVLSAIGRHLGIAYQLTDDELGAFGEPERTGKPVGSDIRSGKRTELLRLAMTRADPVDRQFLFDWVGDEAAPDDALVRIQHIMEHSGARAAHRKIIGRHTHLAVALIEAKLPGELARGLRAVIDALAERTT